LSGVLVVLAALFAPIVAAQAQSLMVAQMRVSLWPEYDDPRLLVLYRGELPTGTTLPQTVEFRIPAGAEVNATAYAEPDGRLLANPYTTRVEGDWQIVTFSINTVSFQLEFYAPLIQGPPSSRQFDFRFSTIYPITDLQVDVQQPLRSTDFQVTPAPAQTSSDSGGFQYAEYDFGSVAADASFDFKASYSKSDATPSVPRVTMPPSVLTVPTVAPAPSPVGGGPSAITLLAFGLGAAGVFLIGSALVLRNRRPAPVPTTPGRAQRATRGATAPFCTECGTRLAPGARFCSQCGAPVRRLAQASEDDWAEEAEAERLFGLPRQVVLVLLVAVVVLVALAVGWLLGQNIGGSRAALAPGLIAYLNLGTN
jgi:hypothetical protein